MGKVTVAALVENLGDVFAVREGRLSLDEIRSVDIPDALVDSGATGLSMPKSLLSRLGLTYLRTRKAMTGAGPVEVRIFGTVRLTVQERDCPVDVTELPDGCPVLIGQIPLEAMDFVIDLPSRRVIGNPEHGGEQVIEIY